MFRVSTVASVGTWFAALEDPTWRDLARAYAVVAGFLATELGVTAAVLAAAWWGSR